MATGSWPTLIDLASRTDPEGKIGLFAEMLSQCNEIYQDVPFVQSNESTGYEFIFRTSIPTGSWRSYYQGTPFGKSTTNKGRAAIGELVAWSQIDESLVRDSNDPERFRSSEEMAFVEGMAQTITQTIVYGNTIFNPSEFMGLAPFYSTLNTSTYQNAANVIDAGGTGSSNTSIWLCNWGERKLFGVVPRGSQAGLQTRDFGDTWPAFDSLGNPFVAMTQRFEQRMGLCPQDWRQTVRIANIDVTNAGLAGPNAPDLFALMIEAVLLPPALGRAQSGITTTDAPGDPVMGGRSVWYTCRTGRHWMDIQMIRDRNVLLSMNDYDGRPVEGFRQSPLKIVDQLLTTEARVV